MQNYKNECNNITFYLTSPMTKVVDCFAKVVMMNRDLSFINSYCLEQWPQSNLLLKNCH